jgi:hypothetical protein
VVMTFSLKIYIGEARHILFLACARCGVWRMLWRACGQMSDVQVQAVCGGDVADCIACCVLHAGRTVKKVRVGGVGGGPHARGPATYTSHIWDVLVMGTCHMCT